MLLFFHLYIFFTTQNFGAKMARSEGSPSLYRTGKAGEAGNSRSAEASQRDRSIPLEASVSCLVFDDDF